MTRGDSSATSEEIVPDFVDALSQVARPLIVLNSWFVRRS